MNRDERQYQLNHIFNEFLVSMEQRLPVGKRTGNSAVAINSRFDRRQR